MKEKIKMPCEIEYNFYLVNVKRSTVEEGASNEPSTESDIPKLYLKALTRIQLDTFVITHGPFTSVIGELLGYYFVFGLLAIMLEKFTRWLSSCVVLKLIIWVRATKKVPLVGNRVKPVGRKYIKFPSNERPRVVL